MLVFCLTVVLLGGDLGSIKEATICYVLVCAVCSAGLFTYSHIIIRLAELFAINQLHSKP